MSETNGVVLIHGAWHDHHCWDEVVPLLEAGGIPVTAIELPGAGRSAALPESFLNRPLDPAAFATEPSPNAGVSQVQRTEAAIAAVREMNEKTGGKAVVVGHSKGGLTLTPLAEAIPDEISHAVYLAAFLLPPGMVAGQMIGHPLMAEALVPTLFMADPADVGALRMDVRSEDPAYRAGIKATFYADVADASFDQAIGHLHPDEPAQIVTSPSPATPGRFGRVPRHYIECTGDQAVTIAAQREMVRLMDEAMGTPTNVFSMNTSHSPFFADPQGLASILNIVARK
ncbi:alpha/beta fold hydrolase [Pseudooceanicola sp. C21-150M6]|uniref:alpha/beta fold hydrolase n=1 Tax=Pseudooceanicola sp. C21-150M6 TaxID=3434355 RepID=UPI003D7F805F